MTTTKPDVLLLTGGIIHDFETTTPIYESFLSRRFNLTVTRDVNDLKGLPGSRYSAVLIQGQGPKGEMTDDIANALKKFVSDGGGLVGTHAAAAGWRDNETYLNLLGAEFQTHGPKFEFNVRLTDPEHPCTARCSDFRIFDELYLLKQRADFHTFAVAHWQGKDQPMGYEHQVGSGRVIYLANGHDARSVSHPNFQRMVERALRVACGETFPTQIKAGVIGYGGAFNMGRQHSGAINAQPGMEVVGVCDLDPARTDLAKEELPGITTSNDMDAFLNEGQFDLVIGILPHNLHAAACIKAAKAGKHVVTEKPFCITLDEADEMIAAARETNVMLSCFHNRRWDADFLAALHSVRQGEIGQVFRIDAALGGYKEPGAWWRSSKEISGGQMYDWGAHYTDWILTLTQKRIKSVTGDFQKRRWHHVTNEDYTYALIRFEDDTTATLEQSTLASVGRKGLRILGSDGGLINEGPGGEFTRVTFDGTRRIEAKIPNFDGNKWSSYYSNVGNHLIMGEELVIKAEQARRTIGVIYLAEQSAKAGGVPMELPGEQDFEPNYIWPW